MAKRRKHNVGQLSLFDAMASQIEQIRAENIQDDMRDESTSEPASQPKMKGVSRNRLGKRTPFLSQQMMRLPSNGLASTGVAIPFMN